MQIDRENLEKLLSLSDRRLEAVIRRVVAESGVDPAEFHINPTDIQSIRQAISSASDADLARVAELYQQNQKKKG